MYAIFAMSSNLSSFIMERSTFLYTLSITTFLLASAANSAVHSIMSDQDALLALKDHITLDPNQTIATNWSAGSSICDWTGVSCGKHHHRVTALDISNMGLTGTIVPHLGNLSFLVSINLGGNNFHGELPYELGHLSRLKTLNLSFNALTGEIPSSLGSLNQLQYLSLAYNHLSGTIPKEMSKLSSLQLLYLSDNPLTGMQTSLDGEKKAEMFRELHARARTNVEAQTAKYEKHANKGKKAMIFEPGDWVWLHFRKDRFPHKRKTKLHPRGDGPFQVLERINNNAYKLDIPADWGVSNSFNVADLYPFDNPLDLRTDPSQQGGSDMNQGPLPSHDPLTFRVGPETRAQRKKRLKALDKLVQLTMEETKPKKEDCEANLSIIYACGLLET